MHGNDNNNLTDGEQLFNNSITRDLNRYNINANDIDARNITNIDIEAMNLSSNIRGYKIPYISIDGNPINHFRIRQLPEPNVPGHKGSFIRCSRDQTNVYFPQMFGDIRPSKFITEIENSTEVVEIEHTPLIIVDDERLATQIVKNDGYLSVAIQGPAGWRCNLGLAEGFKELCEKVIEDSLTVVLWIGNGTDKNIQREVANIAMELKFHGVPFKNIRQLVKDDISESSLRSVLDPLSMFPKHPNIRSYIQEKIGDTGAKLTRRDQSEIALAVLSDMESKGTRIQSLTNGDFYYFDKQTKELVQASMNTGGRELMTNSAFLSSVYTKYGLSSNDGSILKWLSTQFMAEEPIYRTKSYRVMMCESRSENTFALQLTPSEFIYIRDGKEAEIKQNGDHGILFEKSSIGKINIKKLELELEAQRKKATLDFWWGEIAKEIRLDTGKGNNFKVLLALLYYISPWLKGWREIQLPIEVITGEAGTGKSSIFSLRLNIISGDPELKGLPDSIRNWHTEVVNTTGMCVFDNIQLNNKIHKQALSDEMCRIVTEPNPTINMRQLYKTAEIAKMPVHCTFGLTSIQNVFTNIDFIQRAIIMHLERPYTDKAIHNESVNNQQNEVLYAGWVNEKLKHYGGREAWLANHIIAIERFFKIVESDWNYNYKSTNRLINLEQSLIIMGKVFGINVESWLPSLVRDNYNETAISVDWILEGLHRFSSERKKTSSARDSFSAKDVADWAICLDDFEDNDTLTNPRRLGRYISSHKTVVQQTTGIVILSNNKRGSLYAIEERSGFGKFNTQQQKGAAHSRNRPRTNNRSSDS